jgi:hypothetical protein
VGSCGATERRYLSMHNRVYHKKTPIYAWGRRHPVGAVVGDEFQKTIKHSGYLREPPAICLDVKSIKNAEKAGARWVVIIDKDDGRIHRASIAKIWRDGFDLNRGFGLQRGLLISEWVTTTKPKQLSLFLPAKTKE